MGKTSGDRAERRGGWRPGAWRAGVVFAAALLAAGVAEAARVLNYVGPIPYPTAPSAAINDVPVNVTTSGSGTADDWRSTRFTWTDGAASTFSACSIDPTPDVTGDITRSTRPIDAVAPNSLVNPWVSVRAEAFELSSCGGTGSSPIIAGSDSFTFNRDLVPGCGQDIILILDESRSIADTNGTNYTSNVVAGARAFLEAIADTGSRVSLIEFGSAARFVNRGALTGTGDYVEVTTVGSNTFTDFNAYLNDQTGLATDPDGYCPGCNPVQYTNWQDALGDAATVISSFGRADLVVFLTDGNPTTDNVPGNGCDQTFPPPAQCLPPALAAANALKGLGAHILVAAVGGDINLGNIQLISGPDEITTGATIADIQRGDFTRLGFTELATAFRRLAFALCAPSLTVNKVVDPDGPTGPAGPVPAALVPFSGDVQITTPGQSITNYQWVSPQAAADCVTPTPEAGLGCPGPGTAGAPDNRGFVQTGWTDAGGSLNFGWVPGTVANPQTFQSRIIIKEDLASYPLPLTYRELLCRRQRLDLGTGTFTQTTFGCVGTTCSGDCQGVVCADLSVAGVEIGMDSGDIVACAVTNDGTPLDYGDAPDTGPGTGPGNYQTTVADSGPSHVLFPDFHLGAATDADDGTLQNAAADADDVTNTGAADDEDGVSTLPVITSATTSLSLDVAVTNSAAGGVPGALICYIDFNRDGVFTGAGEQSTPALVPYPASGTVSVGFSGFAPPSPGQSYLRCRLGRGTDVTTPSGPGGPGEVEDYAIQIEEARDFGDAPDSYGTTLASNGARHAQVPELYLGTQIDVEPDARTPLDGTGDDVNPATPDDEDGVTFQTFAGPGFPLEATVTGSVGDNNAALCGYLDGAADGVVDGVFTQNITNYGTLAFGWGTATAVAGNEEVCILIAGGNSPATINLVVPAVSGFNGASATCQTDGVNKTFQCTLTFNPNFTTPVTTYARFRLTRDGTFLNSNQPSPIGPANSGEVEDYRILVNPTAVTIGSVELAATAVADFLADLGADGLDTQALLDLLAAWDPAAAAALAGADREAILAALRAYLDPDGDGQVAVLRWDTLEQRGTVGFYVDRDEPGGERVRINGDMLPALIGAPLGGEYLLADPRARAGVPYEYLLIEQEAWGSTRTYGPFPLELVP